jgi:hypothetical protein
VQSRRSKAPGLPSGGKQGDTTMDPVTFTICLAAIELAFPVALLAATFLI